jgi:hypothetical protein
MPKSVASRLKLIPLGLNTRLQRACHRDERQLTEVHYADRSESGWLYLHAGLSCPDTRLHLGLGAPTRRYSLFAPPHAQPYPPLSSHYRVCVHSRVGASLRDRPPRDHKLPSRIGWIRDAWNNLDRTYALQHLVGVGSYLWRLREVLVPPIGQPSVSDFAAIDPYHAAGKAREIGWSKRTHRRPPVDQIT